MICDLVGSNYAVRTLNKKRKGFFDLWSRDESNEVIYEILHCLGFSDCVAAAHNSSEYNVFAAFSALPKLDVRLSPLNLIQAHALFQKNSDMLAPIDRKGVAYESFLESERSCAQINSEIDSGHLYHDPALAHIVHVAQRYIAKVLGPVPDLESLECDFGPGSSASDSTKIISGTTARWKLSSTCTISTSAFAHFAALRACYPAWLQHESAVPVIGLLDFVPKSFKTDRSIMIEPLMNTFVQKGIGRWIRKRLYRHGIDLADQSVQRERAREGSISERWATIDLSRASDSIAYRLVMDLLPWEWFALLDTWRTPMCRYKEDFITLEKFSSMGNGFTFELETLIFKALLVGIASYTEVSDDSSVYGDDITCSTDLARGASHFFPFFGFSINRDKSFLEGVFREACGGDYRLGVDVRPWFCRGLRDGGRFSYAKIFSFYNFLQRKPWFDVDKRIRTYLLSKIPEPVRRYGPDGYGDIWLLSLAPPRSYLKPASAKYVGWEGYLARGYSAVPHRNVEACRGDSLLPAYLAGRGPALDVYAVRAPKGSRLTSREVTVLTVEGRKGLLEDIEGCPILDPSQLVHGFN